MKARKTRPSKLEPYAEELRVWFRDEQISLAAAKARLAERGVSTSAASLSDWWATDQLNRLDEPFSLGSLKGMSYHRVTAVCCILASCHPKLDPAEKINEAIRCLHLELASLTVKKSKEPCLPAVS